MPDAFAIGRAVLGFAKSHPLELVHALREAARLRVGVPLALLEVVGATAGRKALRELRLEAAPPGLRVAAIVDVMKTPLRLAATIEVDEVRFDDTALRLSVRLRDVEVEVAGASDSPVAALLRSGALDLSRPGDLARYMPKRSPALVEAEGDRLVLDFMRLPAVASNRRLRRALALGTPVVGLRAIQAERDHLYVALRATPAALPGVLATALGR